MKQIGKRFLLKVATLASLLWATGIATSAYAGGWTNPMTLPGLQNRSLGDPYIMKYRGYYYLYVSADDRNIYCWRTKDLMEWSEAYVCCTDATTAVAYAPEVIYWNGTFYMCTSPRGGGHYLLTSDSPTGPFVHKTDNLGRDIDGSMFVDDDGKLYFYHANNGGIRGCTMSTALTLGNDVDLGCCISGQWTEGPCVFKRNNLYYLLYTGNHVWTNGYRIDYAISNSGPLSGFRPQSEQNPILVDTETPLHKALGHGTAFVGPDLDSYYFCYHNLQDNKARRLLNFERIAWNGDKLMMTGPTDWEQDRPAVATADYFERTEPGEQWTMSDGQWTVADGQLSQSEHEGRHQAIFEAAAYDDYTAEATVRAAAGTETGRYGALFSYRDAGNYVQAVVNVGERKLEVSCYVDGEEKTLRTFALPGDFDASAWHAIRVEKSGRRMRVYIDGMRKVQLALPGSSGGKVAYVSQDCAADFGYVAISPYVDGNGVLDASLPLPGMLAANLCVEMNEQVRLTPYSMTVGSSNYMRCSAGAVMKYRVNIQRDNVYNIGIRYHSTAASRLRLLLDDEVVADNVELPASRNNSVVTIQDVALAGGRHTLTVEVVDGSPYIMEYNIKRGVREPHTMADDFENGFCQEWGYREGNWNIVDGWLESTGGYGKMLMGGFEDIHLTDYTVECDVNYATGATNAGLLFRTTNASTGGADDNPVLGTDFLQGYIFIASATSVTLGKHNFGWQALVTKNHTISLSEPHHMKVEVEGATIRCYIDDMEQPVIEYTDAVPFITGRAGFRAHDSRVLFDNFKVTPKAKTTDAITVPEAGVGQPSEEPARLYNLQGQALSIDSAHPRGIYILCENGSSRKVATLQ